MSNFVSIDLAVLASVSGGDGTQQQTSATAEVKTKAGSASVSGSQTTSTNQSERNQCLQNLSSVLCPVGTVTRQTSDPDACASRLNAVCGPPSGGGTGTARGTKTTE